MEETLIEGQQHIEAMDLLTIIGIIIGAIFILNLLLAAFGGINPNKFRKALNSISTFGIKIFIIYLITIMIFTVFAGLSVEHSVRAVLGNIFVVILIALLAAVFLSGFFPSKDEE
jgi:magnesium-transporting ATPase (P-type)